MFKLNLKTKLSIIKYMYVSMCIKNHHVAKVLLMTFYNVSIFHVLVNLA